MFSLSNAQDREADHTLLGSRILRALGLDARLRVQLSGGRRLAIISGWPMISEVGMGVAHNERGTRMRSGTGLLSPKIAGPWQRQELISFKRARMHAPEFASALVALLSPQGKCE